MSIRSVNIYEAKTNLSKLVDAAAAGEEIVLARNGRPLARLVAFVEPAVTGDRGFGSDPNLVVPDDFDGPLPPDVLASFGG